LNKLLAGGIDISARLAEIFEWLLKTFHAITDPLFGDIQQLGNFLKLPWFLPKPNSR